MSREWATRRWLGPDQRPHGIDSDAVQFECFDGVPDGIGSQEVGPQIVWEVEKIEKLETHDDHREVG